jgi:hypothetical protein
VTSHGAQSTMNPRDDPLHPLFSLSCAEGWSVKADVMNQVLRKHFQPHGQGYDRACLDVASLPWCHGGYGHRRD